jgi:ABC-type polysaccharide/polyol phosphate transport system ATPase subunit
MATVSLRSVHAEYQLLSVRDYNLKNRVVQSIRRRVQEPVIIEALRSVDLDIREGSRLGLVGPNGAGKSTLLSIMAGLLPPTRGSVRVEGRVLALLGGSEAGLDQEATGRDNVVSMGVQLGESPSAMRGRLDDITEFSGLGERILHPAYSYSSGMQTRLRFSILTSLQPDVLLLDEGLGTADAEFTARANRRLEEFMSSAGILVLASHGDALLKEQCTEAVWLQAGVIVGQGAVDDVLRGYHHSYSTGGERLSPDPPG